jgi:DNA modification methylase
VTVRILQGDCRDVLKALPAESVHCCVTSPPYFGLRNYGVNGQIGLEPTPDAYVAALVTVFREIRRVLRNDGTLWLNLGDSYTSGDRATFRSGASQNKGQHIQNDMPRPVNPHGLKPKDLIGIPWRVAFALQADGWWLRQDIIWSKPNPMPESVTDRCTKAHEYLFLLSKRERYYYDQDAIREEAVSATDWSTLKPKGWANEGAHDAVSWATASRQGRSGNKERKPRGKAITSPRNDGNSWNENNGRGFMPVTGAVAGSVTLRNKRSVWEIPTQPYSEAHFATFPPALVEPCILAGCPKGETVLDPFGGAGTTGLVADRLQRNAILIELNPEYAAITQRRLTNDAPLFADVISEE